MNSNSRDEALGAVRFLARDLVRALELARRRTVKSAYNVSHGYDTSGELDLALDLAGDLAFDWETERARDLAYSVILFNNRNIDLVPEIALQLYTGIHHAVIPNYARTWLIDRELAKALKRACTISARIQRLLDDDQANLLHDQLSAGLSANWLAIRAAGMAVEILPQVDRARYGAEFAAELNEIARRSRWAAMQYVLGLVCTAWSLRRALVRSHAMPVPEGDRV